MTIQKADAREKRIAVILIAVLIALAGGLSYGFFEWKAQITLIAKAGDVGEATRQLGILELFVFGVMIISALGVAAILAINSAKALQEKRYPAAGVPVFRSVVVLTGDSAVRKAKQGLALAALALLAALIALYFALTS